MQDSMETGTAKAPATATAIETAAVDVTLLPSFLQQYRVTMNAAAKFKTAGPQAHVASEACVTEPTLARTATVTETTESREASTSARRSDWFTNLLSMGVACLVLTTPVCFVLYARWEAEGCNTPASWWLACTGVVALLLSCAGGRAAYQNRYGSGAGDVLLCCVISIALLTLLFLSIGIGMGIPPLAGDAEQSNATRASNATGGELSALQAAGISSRCLEQLMVHRALAIAMLAILTPAVLLAVAVPIFVAWMACVLLLQMLDYCCNCCHEGEAHDRSTTMDRLRGLQHWRR